MGLSLVHFQQDDGAFSVMMRALRRPSSIRIKSSTDVAALFHKLEDRDTKRRPKFFGPGCWHVSADREDEWRRVYKRVLQIC